MKYKHTLHLPKTEFSMKANLVQNEEFFKAFWRNESIWEKTRNKPTKKYFILHDGPPYANGNIHVGHALNKILKDFIIRYKSLKGFQIKYIPGWDTHGLPIENKVEKTHGYKNLSTIEKRKLCKEYALSQLKSQKKQFEKLHLICDFQEVYKTLDDNYIKNEFEILKEFFSKNLLYWKLKPVAWSWSSKTALAESEIVYKEIEETSIYFWFPSKSNKYIPENTRLLIWTTTPYTLEANQGIIVHPEYKYELIEKEGKYYVCIKGFLSENVIKEFSGKDIEGLEYINPITRETRKVICDEYVKKEIGTGLIHMATGNGMDDYQIGTKHQIDVYCQINDEGYFTNNTKFEPINNLFYTDASKVIIDWLKDKGYLFKEEKIKHNIGHDWRTEKPLLYKASPQWFLNIDQIKKEISEIEDIESKPSWIYDQLKKLICSRNEWCLSRQRVWGVPIPILFDDADPIIDLKQIQHTINLLSKHGIDAWFNKKPEFFLLESVKITGTLKKSTDILDVWFDSGCSWKIFDESIADIYIEGIDQLRGWFNSSSIIRMIIDKKIPFKNLIGHGFVLDGSGNKMSKSRGNVIDPIEICNKYGADILRLWLGMNDYTNDIKLSQDNLEKTISIYKKIRNTIFRYSLSIIPDEFVFDPEILDNLQEIENRKIYEEFKKAEKKIDEYLEKYEFFNAINIFIKFMNEYSGWYLEINKDEVYCGIRKENRHLNELFSIVYEILRKSIVFFSIFIPQTSEEAYMHFKKEKKYEGKESVFLENW